VRVGVDLGAAVERRPLGLVLEETHGLDVLHPLPLVTVPIYLYIYKQKDNKHTFFSSVVNR